MVFYFCQLISKTEKKEMNFPKYGNNLKEPAIK